ncbi:putative cytochrome P450 monooxygenase [Sclerotinia borealis F-4128]|uniref:Putative cytochrome P450 monooxygenase n=1 Tax=Sclerotinia borealis (strain F-4128) TaxID=1432307 RepID=W9CAP0_SCLBF|nr:putative cytochrome P450 monooxygenase [Sclerotinia borealis F-4128]
MENSQTISARVSSYLNLGNLLWLLLAWILVPFLYQIIYYRFFHPLRQYPGPFWGTVTRLWYTYQSYNQTELTTYQNLFEKTKAPVLRISPTTLLVKSSSALPLIYHRTAVKSRFYSNGAFASIPIFTIRGHQAHAYRRRLVAPPYSYSKIVKAEPLVDKMILAWLTKLTELFAQTQVPIDMGSWATYVAFDTISEVGFGQALGFVEKGEDVGGLIESVHEGIHIFGVIAHLYPFVEWLTTGPLGGLFAVTPDMKNGMGQLIRWRDKIIGARITEIEEGKRRDRVDLLQSFFEAKTPEGMPMDKSDMEAEVLVILLAGADTTGTAFSSFLTDIISSPDAYARMMTEIDTVFASGNLSQPIPKAAEVSKHCPFYVSCVKESLRLNPPSPALFPREVTADQPPLIIDGKVIPIGTEITCSPYLTNRDKEIYGEDADLFRPDRWLENGGEKAKVFDKYNFTWGYGSRVCLGKDLAMMELMKFPLMVRLYFVHAIKQFNNWILL